MKDIFLQLCPFLKPNPDLEILLSLLLTPISEQTCPHPFTLPSLGELLLKSKIANLTRIAHPVVFDNAPYNPPLPQKKRPPQESQSHPKNPRHKSDSLSYQMNVTHPFQVQAFTERGGGTQLL